MHLSAGWADYNSMGRRRHGLGVGAERRAKDAMCWTTRAGDVARDGQPGGMKVAEKG